MEDNTFREPFDGRYFGILCVESDDPAPRFMFRSEEEARRELTRRQALPDDHDDYLDLDNVVFPVDIVGTIWNCVDPDPRADSPLGLIDIAREHLMPGESITIERAKPAGSPT